MSSKTSLQIRNRLREALAAAGFPHAERGVTQRIGKAFDVSRETARKWLDGQAVPEIHRLVQISELARNSTPEMTTTYILDGIKPLAGFPHVSIEARRLIDVAIAADHGNHLPASAWSHLTSLLTLMAAPGDEVVTLKRTAKVYDGRKKLKGKFDIALSYNEGSGLPTKLVIDDRVYLFEGEGTDPHRGEACYLMKQIGIPASEPGKAVWINQDASRIDELPDD